MPSVPELSHSPSLWVREVAGVILQGLHLLNITVFSVIGDKYVKPPVSKESPEARMNLFIMGCLLRFYCRGIMALD